MRPDPQQPWWRRRWLLALLVAVGAAYVAVGWWHASAGQMIVRGGPSPTALYAKFVLVEMFFLLAMLPLTWLAIVRRLRRA